MGPDLRLGLDNNGTKSGKQRVFRVLSPLLPVWGIYQQPHWELTYSQANRRLSQASTYLDD